ncbi:MAG: class I tRNA ligase family protein [Planctomycetales bacterium]|nr:class I tRNA ligase family protein [Planctomycetales bacterium]NIM09409.1 class I tRNA ligase family protein [Planctomycetales bacterium]NIN08883.1 class I tRNA ligase family protein [Planctomycetales bacterium]NIN77998.1 class I tRNA ligase family protein [Planctomycetales bacterium]NIO35181.1 class I tRNA ligase family protein [Planctomycetales bacterium]
MDLPKQYDHQAAEQRWYPFWEERGYFHSQPDAQRQPFSIVIPPPNVTGALHLGHALNNTLQDIVIRFRRMQGFNVLWMPGTDHAGIATQAVVERRLLEEEGKTRHDLGRQALVQRIWAWKDQYEARILGQLKKMGCSCDWQRTRFTLDEICARAVRQTFFDLFRHDLIYRGKRLVNWDTHLQTAVSDDEVFHEEVDGHFWHFQYPVLDPQPGEPEFVSIATTRPETMLGDTAVAVHPDPAAALDQLAKELQEKLAAAPEKEKPDIEAQLENVRQRQTTHLPRLLQLRDMARDGRQLLLPLIEREIPLIADEWAKPELGSGCVKITPAHDPNDYDVGIRQDLPMVNILNPDGTLNANAGAYQGDAIQKARRRVVADLEKRGLVERIEERKIDLAHSDRSKTPIEPFLADQWFVKMDQLAQSAMDAVRDGRVQIIPPRYGKSYLDWLGEKRDWCISRNLWWGHRIPIWSATRSAEEETWLSDNMAQNRGVAVRLLEGTEDQTARILVCIAPGGEEIEQQLQQRGFVQEEEVLDTWFSSALWPHSTLGWPDKTPELDYYYPTSVLITSRDIITLWVARMVLTGLYNVGDIPFQQVYIHPKILDGYGETMSKSKGNGVDPLDVVDKFGADPLRFGLAYMTTETQDVRMPVEFECPHCQTLIEQTKKNRLLPVIQCKKCGKSFSTQWATSDEDQARPRGAVVSERFELGRNFSNKLWNASRFVLMNLADYQSIAISDDQLQLEDRWILSRLATVTATVSEALEHYRYAEAARTLYDFAWDEFCSFYVEMVKSRFGDRQQGPVAQAVLVHTLDTLLRLLHPMIPFLTEDVWQRLGKVAQQRGIPTPIPAAESIMVAPWPTADLGRQDQQIEARFARFQAALGGIREIRSRQNVPPKKEVHFAVRCDQETADLLRPMQPYFQAMATATATAWGPQTEAPQLSSHASLAGMEIFVDLADLIDIHAEIARNEKERTRLQGMINGKEKKLANHKFVDRAPADVVDRERDSLNQLRQQLTSLDATLANLRSRS